jgi:hypothetical protein
MMRAAQVLAVERQEPVRSAPLNEQEPANEAESASQARKILCIYQCLPAANSISFAVQRFNN